MQRSNLRYIYLSHILFKAFALLALLSLITSTPLTVHAAQTLTVTNTNDTGAGSFRQAVTSAASGDTITFAPTVTGTITLTTGGLAITTNLTIIGPGPSVLAIDGGNRDGIFSVSAASTVLISGLALQHGDGSTSPGRIASGAIANAGTLTVIDCIFDDNSGAVGQGFYDGVITNTGSLTVSSSVFRNNVGTQLGNLDFLRVIKSSGVLVVTGSTFENNGADYASSIATTGTTLIRNSTFSNNSGLGGVISFGGGNTIVDGSTIISNAVDVGIAVSSDTGTLKVKNSTVANNSGTGISADGAATVQISNTTISNNSLRTGALFPIGAGVSVASNASVSMGSTIVTGNLTNGTANDLTINPAAAGTFTSLGNNVVGTSIGSPTFVGTDQTGINDAKLGSLSSNGGLTQTIPLLPGSPALRHGNCMTLTGVSPVLRDQRGISRKTPCDVGAYEKAALTFTQRQEFIGVYRPSNDTFYLSDSNLFPTAATTTVFGSNAGSTTIHPVTGDWDGDGIDTIGILRGNEFLLKNSNAANAPVVYDFVLGAPGDLPMAGDWNGDGKDGVGVFRPSNGLIFLKNNLTTGFADFQMVLGVPGDQPVAGDWDGDGLYSPGIYRPSTNTFFLTNSVCNCSAIGNYAVTLGTAGDLPVAGDWDGSVHTGIGVFHPANGTFSLKDELTNGPVDHTSTFGTAGDLPIAGHWPALASAPAVRNPAITPTEPISKLAPTFVP